MTLFIRSAASASAIALALGLAAQAATAAPGDRDRAGGAPQSHGREGGGFAEDQRGPQGYARLEQPRETNSRPRTLDGSLYHHNFTANRGYHIGPYHPPRGFQYRRLHYGEILPPLFWRSQYLLTDYWLFGLDIPPLGYEWVRYGPDALLINTTTGEVVSVVYDDFV